MTPTGATDMTDLSEKAIKTAELPATGNRIIYFPEASRTGKAPVGFAVRVTAAGARSFVLCYRDATGEHRATVGKFPTMSLDRAIRDAAKLRLAIDAGEIVAVKRGTKAAKVEQEAVVTVGGVLDDWIKSRRGQRRIKDREGVVRRHLQPDIGSIPIMELKKRPIVAMLDHIAADTGPAAANNALACLSAALNWYAARGDDFVAPVLKGLKLARPSRDRILTHAEIAVLWPTFGAAGVFGSFCKLLLLTAQRRNEIADACWSEIDGAALTIPAARYKTARDHTVPLSAPARELLAALPRRPGSDRLFAPEVGGFNSGKRRLDALAPGIAHWTLHDLRRTATSLMIEARIRPDYVERVTHPQIAGIAGIYNRHAYLDEKREALDALAAMIERITNPPAAGNVVPLRA